MQTDHRALPREVGWLGPVRDGSQVWDLVANEDGGVSVAGEGVGETPARCGHKQRIEAVWDRAVGDRHGEVRLAASWFPDENQTPAFGDKIRCQGGAQARQAEGALMQEIEIVDRLQKRKARARRTMPAMRVC